MNGPTGRKRDRKSLGLGRRTREVVVRIKFCMKNDSGWRSGTDVLTERVESRESVGVNANQAMVVFVGGGELTVKTQSATKIT